MPSSSVKPSHSQTTMRRSMSSKPPQSASASGVRDSPSTNCAAPITRERPSASTQPEYLRAELKATARAIWGSGSFLPVPSARSPSQSPAKASKALAVSFASEALAAAMAANAATASASVEPGAQLTWATSISPEVMVPVLSRQSVSTRARVSTQ